ncbi:MAG: Sapep family Mn(2+)-dependent dipeptidase [Emergencia timonensis]|uniref:Sapep family Mn(2+)-dependent dipeptidase n=1 Tax=Emergencia timonensis TaxID=1776384 RepID=UPI00082A1030|nr:Sapep family Mn(2+)-dependent dipeptidase [Emergencia timonensis]WNX88588.1 Sapep family Mn(2+)-dependent dipeptidase [Emergencia timonensis]
MTLERDKMIRDLKGLIDIPSISSDKAAVEEALDYVLKLGEQMGMRCEKVADGQVGIIEIGQGDETFGILTHVDVVNAGREELWKSPPFACEVRDGNLYGRGAIDDKGPTVAVLYAMGAAMENGKPFHKTVRLIVGTQEETEWTDMDCYTEHYPLPDYGFTPDGDFPIGNVEKGCMDVTLRFPVALVDEASPQIVGLEAGTAFNIVPDSCSALLSDGRVIVTEGKAVHTCAPEKGENAIFQMPDLLEGVTPNGFSQVLEMVTEFFSDCTAPKLGLRTKEEYFAGEFIHRTVFTPVLIRTSGSFVEVGINVRFAYTTTEDELLRAFRRLCEEYEGEIACVTSLPAVFVSRNTPFLEVLATAYEEATGLNPDFVLGYGGSYAKAMPGIVSFGPILPGMKDCCHEENEYIPLKALEKNCEIYYRAIEGIAQCEKSFRR